MKATYVTHSGSDLMVVNAARVSFAKESEWGLIEVCPSHPDDDKPLIYHLREKDQKLIKYLASHKHFSPFNHCFVTLHVKAPIFVARQLQKHEYMPWSEISRRYVDDEPEFYVPEVWRGKSTDKKQGSSEEPFELNGWSKFGAEDHMVGGLVTYRDLIKYGVAPEMARMVLPQSTYTEWYWSGTLKAWAKMYNLRTKPDAQWETQQIALQCGEIIAPLFPHAWAALKESEL